MHKFPHKKKYIHKRLLSIIMRLIVVYTVFNRDFFSCSTIYPMQIDCLILIKLNETKKKKFILIALQTGWGLSGIFSIRNYQKNFSQVRNGLLETMDSI
jgi:branched-subunit amino acid transport protein AzlD